MSSSRKIDNRKKDIFILGKGPTQGLEYTLSVEKLYSINFTKEKAKFCLSLHYNGGNSYLFVNGTEIVKFKAKDSEINPYDLCLGNSIRMFKFIRKIFVSALMFFDDLSSVNPLECVSMSKQKCKVKPEIVNVNSNEPLFYPFSIRTSK